MLNYLEKLWAFWIYESGRTMMFGGKIMDNFMDKLAQKFNAGDLIKANSQAEAMEMQRMKEQMQQYDQLLQEMRKLNLKNVEIMNSVTQLTKESLDKVQLKDQEKEDLVAKIQETIEENYKKSELSFQKAEDFVHKENVKVYRNVQAALVEELKAQTEALTVRNEELTTKVRGLKPLLITTLCVASVLGLANIALFVLNQLGLLPF